MEPNYISKARRHFKKTDPQFYNAIKPLKINDFGEHGKGDIYHALIRAIMGQQLSVKASQTIYDRFLQLFESGYPDAERLITFDDQLLRTKGVSRQKAGYVKNVAQFFIDENWLTKEIGDIPDEDLITRLPTIKGVGIWTVQMVLMFTLNRPDIFPVDDLGIQNAMRTIYNIESVGRAFKKEIKERSAVWSPYRTIGCMYLWRFTDGGLPIK